MIAWMISAGIAFARAASQPIVNGAHDCLFMGVDDSAGSLANQTESGDTNVNAAPPATISHSRSDRSHFQVRGGLHLIPFRQEQHFYRRLCWCWEGSRCTRSGKRRSPKADRSGWQNV